MISVQQLNHSMIQTQIKVINVFDVFQEVCREYYYYQSQFDGNSHLLNTEI